jgi:hypothetical protein
MGDFLCRLLVFGATSTAMHGCLRFALGMAFSKNMKRAVSLTPIAPRQIWRLRSVLVVFSLLGLPQAAEALKTPPRKGFGVINTFLWPWAFEAGFLGPRRVVAAGRKPPKFLVATSTRGFCLLVRVCSVGKRRCFFPAVLCGSRAAFSILCGWFVFLSLPGWLLARVFQTIFKFFHLSLSPGC